MYEYKDGILYIKKENVPKIEINILNDINASYRQYLEKTIYEDMQFLVDEIMTRTGLSKLGIVARVKPLVTDTHNKSQTRDGSSYYPVYAYFTNDGRKVTDEWEVLRIPFMNASGKINVEGASKVVLAVQRAADDISYSLKSNMFNIAMPYANVRIYTTHKGIKMSYKKKKFPMETIIRAAMYEAGDNTPLSDIFTNTHLLNRMDLNPYVNNQLAYENLHSITISNQNSIGLLGRLNSVQYKLGATREALNETLTLNRAIGQTLSRDVLNYKAGTLVTVGMISEFIRNKINIVYVRNYLIPTGYYMAQDYPIIVTHIDKGTPNSKFLKSWLPQYASYQEIPEDVDLSVDNAIILDNSTELTDEVIHFLIDGGYTSLEVCAKGSNKVLKFSFEREIVGNYTARLGQLLNGQSLPAGRSADEWVYYYNNPNLDPSNPEHLTCHDMIAIVSVIGEILLTGQSFLLDRDTSYLKKVLLVNELFSETLRKTMSEYVYTYHSSIANAITSFGGNSPFWGLTKKWISKMNQEKFLAPADTINLAAEVSQVCHINSIMPSNAEVVDEMRHLAMPFYGRICPYETPAGKKLGLVNTKAIGARIKNGLLYVPYRKVLPTANGIRISEDITWLSVKDELGKKFGDILSLKKDANGNYMNTPVLARIPNPDISDEPFIFKDIMAFELANGYVTAVPEQFLSPTATLIPFACSDDPVRISYGLSQIRQAVYLPNSKRPRVTTSMYKDIVSSLDSLRFIMPCRGTIKSISDTQIVVQSMDGEEQIVYLSNPLDAGKRDTTVEVFYNVGDRVNEGVCIAQAHTYPQPFVVRAPYDARIVSITDNEIAFDKNYTPNAPVNLETVDKISFMSGRIMGQSAIFMNIHVSVGDFVKKGQILADTCASRDGYYTPNRSPLVAYNCEGYNHEDGIVATEKASIDYTSIIAHSIQTTFSKKKYKYHHAYLNDGFKYCKSGDKVGYVTMRSSANEKKGCEANVRATVKANGIPFEVNAIDDNKNSKTFAYHLLGFNKLQSGDKMAGLHGNKGVVSKVLPDSKAPQLKNGKTVHFVLNPCGVPSRMNLGQIDDVHLGLCAEVLQMYFNSDSFNGATPEDVEYIMRYTWSLANTPAIGDNITKTYNKAAFDAVCSAFPELPKAFHEDVWHNIENIIDWRGVFYPDGSADVYDPETDTFYNGRMVIGYPTAFNKLMQEADEKINARAGMLEEQYARTTSQPQKGETSAKGQRMAEMELMALAAMGCHDFIDEILNIKSDNTGARTNAHLSQLRINSRVHSDSCYSRSVENLLYLLEGCGVKLETPKEVADVSARVSRNKYTLDINKLIYENFKSPNQQGKHRRSETVDDIAGVMD